MFISSRIEMRWVQAPDTINIVAIISSSFPAIFFASLPICDAGWLLLVLLCG